MLAGSMVSNIIEQVMSHSNCLGKVINVTARLLRCLFSMGRSSTKKPLTVEDVDVARKVLFIVSMGHTLAAMENIKLDFLQPVVSRNIIYAEVRLIDRYCLCSVLTSFPPLK